MSKKKPPTAKDLEIAEAYRLGETQAEVARRFGLTAWQVRKALTRAGVVSRTAGRLRDDFPDDLTAVEFGLLKVLRKGPRVYKSKRRGGGRGRDSPHR